MCLAQHSHTHHSSFAWLSVRPQIPAHVDALRYQAQRFGLRRLVALCHIHMAAPDTRRALTAELASDLKEGTLAADMRTVLCATSAAGTAVVTARLIGAAELTAAMEDAKAAAIAAAEAAAAEAAAMAELGEVPDEVADVVEETPATVAQQLAAPDTATTETTDVPPSPLLTPFVASDSTAVLHHLVWCASDGVNASASAGAGAGAGAGAVGTGADGVNGNLSAGAGSGGNDDDGDDGDDDDTSQEASERRRRRSVLDGIQDGWELGFEVRQLRKAVFGDAEPGPEAVVQELTEEEFAAHSQARKPHKKNKKGARRKTRLRQRRLLVCRGLSTMFILHVIPLWFLISSLSFSRCPLPAQ